MVKKQKSEKKSESKSKTNRTYIIGAMAAVIVVAVVLIIALSGKKDVPEDVIPGAPEEPASTIPEIITPKYDLSSYSDNLASYVGKEATLSGYLKWEEAANDNNAIINKYYLVDDYENQINLAFAGLGKDFSQFEALFIKGETTTQAYSVTGTFRKTFENTRLEVSSIEEK